MPCRIHTRKLIWYELEENKGELQAQCIVSTVLETDLMTCCFLEPSHGQLKKKESNTFTEQNGC